MKTKKQIIAILLLGLFILLLGLFIFSLIYLTTYSDNGIVSSFNHNHFIIDGFNIEFYGGSGISWIGGNTFDIEPQSHCSAKTQGTIFLRYLECDGRVLYNVSR